jgi:hypothetical protein
MGRKVGRTNTLYVEQQWHTHAHADCYHCGTRDRVTHMHWLPHRQSGTTFALCQACYTRHGSRYAALSNEYAASQAPGA